MNWNKLKNQPFVTIGFLSIQTAVFLLAYLLPGLLIEFRGSMFGPLIALNHEYWRFVTPIFIHYGLMHFAINSVILYYMGQQVEAIYGHGRFFLIYLLSGVMGNVLGFAFNDMNVQAAGASTSLFGIFGAFIVLGIHFKNNPGIQAMVRQFSLFIVLNLVFGLFDQTIDMYGHVGGLIGGILMGNIVALPMRVGKTYSIHVRIISAMILLFLLFFCIVYGLKRYQVI
ncbi:MAG: rhomboid family intramembrane serine protease [Enterococcus sp.]|nr:rhomboid family intramembrane serine protease [Enterococcus sp.]MBP8692737.1 rhomboid family intramembrane serine protease [Enterococcus sp.]MBP9521630.1 rhomboid family intramembrane serine protease [Enterococcus sp.]HRL51435.1 rhomboid family intramembrane serine protease [Enterococcus aquimarinus]HRM23860.1 rhomboid family intramembrane serine protease [Enterococcus aquimarinus]